MTLDNLKSIINNKTNLKLGRNVIKSIHCTVNDKFSVVFDNKTENFCNFWMMKEHLYIAYRIKDNTIITPIQHEEIDEKKQNDDSRAIIFVKIFDKINEIKDTDSSASMKEFLFEEFLYTNTNIKKLKKAVVLEKVTIYFEKNDIDEEIHKSFIKILKEFLSI